jgi:hypothetical protein
MNPTIISKIEPILLETYLATVKNSIGSNLFRNLFVIINGDKKDITENGNLSCAVFVSSILYLFKLIGDRHAMVSSTIRDLKESGWSEIAEPREGCILVWEEKDFGESGIHKHLGFYTGGGKAMSNNPEKGYPTEHEWNNFNGRKVELILWNPKLED